VRDPESNRSNVSCPGRVDAGTDIGHPVMTNTGGKSRCGPTGRPPGSGGGEPEYGYAGPGVSARRSPDSAPCRKFAGTNVADDKAEPLGTSWPTARESDRSAKQEQRWFSPARGSTEGVLAHSARSQGAIVA